MTSLTDRAGRKEGPLKKAFSAGEKQTLRLCGPACPCCFPRPLPKLVTHTAGRPGPSRRLLGQRTQGSA